VLGNPALLVQKSFHYLYNNMKFC